MQRDTAGNPALPAPPPPPPTDAQAEEDAAAAAAAAAASAEAIAALEKELEAVKSDAAAREKERDAAKAEAATLEKDAQKHKVRGCDWEDVTGRCEGVTGPLQRPLSVAVAAAAAVSGEHGPSVRRHVAGWAPVGAGWSRGRQ